MSLDQNLKKILRKFVYFLSREDLRAIDSILHQRLMERTPSYPEQLHYSYWENQVEFWNDMPSPVRPSSGDLEIYQSFLPKESKEERILILGSTPELRDLVAQRPDARVYIADFSYRMPLAMLPFTMFVDPMRERWVRDNWLELAFPENFFDVILGDLVFQQFPPELEPTFLKKINSLLKESGIFVGRTHFLDEASCLGTIRDVVEKTLKSAPAEQFVLLKLRILWLFADPVKRELNRQVSAQKFDEYIKENSITDRLLLNVRDALIADRSSYRNYSVAEEKELEKVLSQYFNIVGKKTANDYEESNIYPIFSLKKNESTLGEN